MSGNRTRTGTGMTGAGTRSAAGARSVRAPVIAVTVLAVTITATSAGCSVQTAGAPKGDLTVSATFDDVQSLVTGHSVQLSDVRIGTVTGIRLDGYRARVTMSIADDQRLPTGVTAAVAKTSLLGENYVRLELPAGTDLRTGPFLHSGSVIARTSVQPDLEQITEKVGPLLTALGGQDVATITDAGATALAGKGPQLNQMIDKAAAISDSYAAASADLTRALDGLGRLGHSLAKGSDELDRLPGNVELAAQRLKNDRAEIKRSVQELRNLGDSFNRKVQNQHAVRLVKLLQRTDGLLAAAVRGKADLKALANAILRFLRSPSASHGGQGLLFVWLRGFLPSGDGQAGSAGSGGTGPGGAGSGRTRIGGAGGGAGVQAQSLDLQRLMGPR